MYSEKVASVTLKFFRGTMKMKIFIVLVFCAYFAAAFPREFNRTISSQLIGKSLPPDKESEERRTAMILSTVEIVYKELETICLGVLVSCKRVAFPGRCRPRDGNMWAFIRYKTEDGIGTKLLEFVNFIPRDDRLFKAPGVAEAEFRKSIDTKYWPEQEKRYTRFAEFLYIGAPVFAIGRDQKTKKVKVKPYGIWKYDDDTIEVGTVKKFPGLGQFADGEPLFFGDRIAGIFVYHAVLEDIRLPIYVRAPCEKIDKPPASTSAASSSTPASASSSTSKSTRSSEKWFNLKL